MTARTRSKSPVSFSYKLFGLQPNGSMFNYYNSTPISKATDFLSDNTKRPCSLARILYTPGPAVQLTKDGKWLATYENVVGVCLDPQNTWSWISPYLSRLKWSKLATSNELDLLTSIAEFDDTLSMLGNSYKKKPTYGSVKWGWVPLVSDIMAVNDAANRVKNSVLGTNGKRISKYNSNDKFTIKTPKLPFSAGFVTHTWDVTVKYRGWIEAQNDILSFYDYMGFHPSPKILWDLVPLSFAIDTILPIGDTLKALTPSKGWVKAANFYGWQVVTAVLKEQIIETPGYQIFTHPDSVKYVYRNHCSGLSLESKPIAKPIQALKAPTWEKVFDLAYLTEAFYQRGKAIFAPHTYRKKR